VRILTRPLVGKIRRVFTRKLESLAGRFAGGLAETLDGLALRPFQLHLELTNICNALCIFCPYQFQKRAFETMSEDVFHRAVGQYLDIGGGSVGLTPIVGEALVDPLFLQRVRFLRRLSRIDRIFVTTNAITLDRYSMEDVLRSGLTAVYISTAGFERESYDRIYRSPIRDAYDRMRDNVTLLVRKNTELGRPVTITIGIRTDRPLEAVMKDPDMQPILEHAPLIDFTWRYQNGGGLITGDLLPEGMKLRPLPVIKEPCSRLYDGPIVLPDGTVIACSCIGAMDALDDLKIGDIHEETLDQIWRGNTLQGLREQFQDGGTPNDTCRKCSSYSNLDPYRTRDGRDRARVNRLRSQGQIVFRGRTNGYFAGG
jgi:radical SAM protein with 4Fe4S-binding SPASM domain